MILAALLAAVTVVPAGQAFTCTPVRVWDGDGPIWCAEGPRIRLAGIAAREIGGECRRGHPCPPASAEAARDHLAGLIGRTIGRSAEGHLLIRGPALRCRSDGSAGGNRTAAWCITPAGLDLNCAMVRSGAALRWARFDRAGRLADCASDGRGGR